MLPGNYNVHPGSRPTGNAFVPHKTVSVLQVGTVFSALPHAWKV